MHANPFDRYQEGQSPLHRMDARFKVVLTLLFVLSCLILPDAAWLGFFLSWLLIVFLSLFSRLGVGYIFKRSFIALPFALAAVTVIFNIPGQTLFTFAFGPWLWTVSDAGLIRFASILIRSWLSVQMAILLVSTTPFPEIIHALRHVHVPKLIVAVVSFMYRYLFVLADESMRLLRAREARSAGGRAGGSLRWRARVAGNMVGQLFLRSYERSERVYNAMLARGYRGEFLAIHSHSVQRQDILFGVALMLYVLLVQWFGR